MSRTRIAHLSAWTILLAAGFALLSQSAAQGQQDPPFPQKDASYTAAVGVMKNLKNIPRGGIPKGDLPKGQEAFKVFAKHYADIIAHPAVWRSSQDLKPDPRMPTVDTNENTGILREIDRFLLVPVPGGIKVDIDSMTGNAEPGDYIREMGAALDAAFRNLIETHQERIVRINAARALAHVARSAAPAHYKTVTQLLADPKTPTEIKYYMFHAAASLLSAIDVYDMKMRKHGANAATIAALVKAIEDCINKPEMLMPGFKPDGMSAADQLPVIGLVRRQAVRALAQVKFVRLPNPGGNPPYLYPAYTLVRVAMSDPSLNPPPAPVECAEAVIGLCHMAPVEWDNTGNNVVPIKTYNPDIAVEAMLQGLITFAAPKVANPTDNTVAWRAYALKIAEALTNWRPLFDPNFNFLKPNNFDEKLVPANVNELTKFVIPKVLYPMEQGGRSDVPEMRKLLSTVQKSPNRKSPLLFTDVKTTTIDFPPPKK